MTFQKFALQGSFAAFTGKFPPRGDSLPQNSARGKETMEEGKVKIKHRLTINSLSCCASVAAQTSVYIQVDAVLIIRIRYFVMVNSSRVHLWPAYRMCSISRAYAQHQRCYMKQTLGGQNWKYVAYEKFTEYLNRLRKTVRHLFQRGKTRARDVRPLKTLQFCAFNSCRGQTVGLEAFLLFWHVIGVRSVYRSNPCCCRVHIESANHILLLIDA